VIIAAEAERRLPKFRVAIIALRVMQPGANGAVTGQKLDDGRGVALVGSSPGA
jgi:hypothetical protein